MASHEFNAFSNQWEEVPPTTPDDLPVYHTTLAEQLIDEPITEEELAEALADLERMGHITSQFTPTARPTVRHVQIDKAVPLFSQTIIDRLLTNVDQLGAATVAYGEALDRHAAAVVDAYESEATLAYAELDFRAKLLAQGVPGSNEPTRKINLDLAVMDDEALSELRIDADKCRHAKIQAETNGRKLDQQQKSLRAQIAALSALLSH